jgi:hypothetical protein
MQVLHIIQVCSSITHFSRDKYLILKIVYPYSYLDLNNCWLTMIIGKTFELITCDSHSQEMNFMPYLVVVFYLMSSHREIRLNRTSLRHANIFFYRVKYILCTMCNHSNTTNTLGYWCKQDGHKYAYNCMNEGVPLWLFRFHCQMHTIYKKYISMSKRCSV